MPGGDRMMDFRISMLVGCVDHVMICFLGGVVGCCV